MPAYVAIEKARAKIMAMSFTNETLHANITPTRDSLVGGCINISGKGRKRSFDRLGIFTKYYF